MEIYLKKYIRKIIEGNTITSNFYIHFFAHLPLNRYTSNRKYK